MFKDLHKVSSKSKIQITIWMSKSFSSNSNVVTYKGDNDGKPENVQN